MLYPRYFWTGSKMYVHLIKNLMSSQISRILCEQLFLIENCVNINILIAPTLFAFSFIEYKHHLSVFLLTQPSERHWAWFKEQPIVLVSMFDGLISFVFVLHVTEKFNRRVFSFIL